VIERLRALWRANTDERAVGRGHPDVHHPDVFGPDGRQLTGQHRRLHNLLRDAADAQVEVARRLVPMPGEVGCVYPLCDCPPSGPCQRR
jgi:hypothetical protein